MTPLDAIGMGAAPTQKKVQFATVDVMRIRDGQIVEHWAVASCSLFSSSWES